MASNRLKPLRKARGLSLVALAARVGTTGQQISHLELGKRQLTVEWLEKLASALGCHPWEIVGGSPHEDALEEKLLLMFRSMSADDRQSLVTEIAKRFNFGAQPKSGTARRTRSVT